MSTFAIELITDPAVANAARIGLTSTPKTLPAWLFYDDAGSQLFEQITTLPEYYLTRTERALFAAHADDIFRELGCSIACPELVEGSGGRSPERGLLAPPSIAIAELGAGTASKTGILLRALTRIQSHVLYQPIDISPSALSEAHTHLEAHVPGLTVLPEVANYITEPIHIHREPGQKVLALYIGSSIGNFSPSEARAILSKLRAQLRPGDALLLGTDLAPSPSKSVETLLAAYDDAAGVTAVFNRNILTRLNRDLDANFDLARFAHRASWNPTHSRIEMHLESTCTQTVHIPADSGSPALTVHFAPGETIHTENSHKFTPASISALLADSRFTSARTFTDPANLFAVTLAAAG